MALCLAAIASSSAAMSPSRTVGPCLKSHPPRVEATSTLPVDDGDAIFNPIDLLLSNTPVNRSIKPFSAGALEQVSIGGNRRERTSSFNLRADHALPSGSGMGLDQAFVLWPETTDFGFHILGGSDHRPVSIDLDVERSPPIPIATPPSRPTRISR